MPAAISSLFGAAFTAAACVAAGRILLGRLDLRLPHPEGLLFAFLTGSACWSLLVFALAAAGLVRPWILLSAGALLMVVCWKRRGCAPASLAPWPGGWKALFWVLLAGFGLLYLFHALAPEISPDGSSYHLGLVARYLREGGFHRLTTNLYAGLSQGLEMLFLSAFAFGGHSAAALAHFTFLVALPLLVFSYARRFGFPAAGAAAALFVFLSPLVGVDGASAYNDVAVACILFAVFYLLQIWEQDQRVALLVPVGLLAGFGYAVKYTAVLALPYAAALVGWKLWRARRPVLRPLLLISVCALLLMVPWMVKNWVWLGNPVSPFFNALFPNPHVTIAFEQEYRQRMRHYTGLSSYWAIPLEVTVRGEVLHGLLGPLFLLTPLGLLALRQPPGRRLLAAGVLFGAPYLTNIGARFLIPSLPFLCLAMALALARLRGALPALVLAHSVASLPPVVTLYCRPHTWRVRGLAVEAALSPKGAERYLWDQLPGHAIARMIDQHVPEGGKVFTINPVSEAYLSRDVLVGYQAALNNTLAELLWMHARPALYHFRFQFPAQPVQRLRVLQTGPKAADSWSVAEVRLYRGPRELPRLPRWRLRAFPNPWDVQMAFDDSVVTHWNSRQGQSAGMRVEVDLGAAETLDAVVLESIHLSSNWRPELQIQSAPGRWQTLAFSFEFSEAPLPLGLRRAAIEEFKSRGIDYLLIHASDDLAPDFLKNSLAWGVTLVDHQKGARLYRID